MAGKIKIYWSICRQVWSRDKWRRRYHPRHISGGTAETDVLPEFIPGQTPDVSEAQRNLDTIAEMQENPCIVKKGTALSIEEVDRMIPRVAMLKKNL